MAEAKSAMAKALEKNVEQRYVKAVEEQKMHFVKNLVSKGTLGTVAGYMLGKFASQISDVLIWYAGLTCGFLGGLHYMNWVTVNFEQIDADITHLVYKTKEAADQ